MRRRFFSSASQLAKYRSASFTCDAHFAFSGSAALRHAAICRASAVDLVAGHRPRSCRAGCSKSAHGLATFSAHSVVQWSSITFFCAGDMRVVLVPCSSPRRRSRSQNGMSMWYFVTLSMPNRTIEPHGKVIASATPLSSTSRASGAEACTLVPPSSVTNAPMVACAGRTFMPFTSRRHNDLLRP